jgi:hypothetical protein
MDNLQLLLVIALLVYFSPYLLGGKEGFATLKKEQKDAIVNFSLSGPNQLNKFINVSSEKEAFTKPMLLLVGMLNGILTPTTKDSEELEKNSKVKEELNKQGINIVSLKDNLVNCIVQIYESPDGEFDVYKVILDPTFSSKLNSVFIELNKIDIAILSSSFMTKDQFCKNSDKDESSKLANHYNYINQILTAYSSLIIMIYTFIMKNIDNIDKYCGDNGGTQHYKEFKKMFETVRTAFITKEDLDKKCPKAEPEKLCASYISEASKCNTNTSSLKTQRTILIVVIVILMAALGYKMFA